MTKQREGHERTHRCLSANVAVIPMGSGLLSNVELVGVRLLRADSTLGDAGCAVLPRLVHLMQPVPMDAATCTLSATQAAGRRAGQ